jgi:hypothetical protein
VQHRVQVQQNQNSPGSGRGLREVQVPHRVQVQQHRVQVQQHRVQVQHQVILSNSRALTVMAVTMRATTGPARAW